jgi:hypothetical protein
MKKKDNCDIRESYLTRTLRRKEQLENFLFFFYSGAVEIWKPLTLLGCLIRLNRLNQKRRKYGKSFNGRQ